MSRLPKCSDAYLLSLLLVNEFVVKFLTSANLSGFISHTCDYAPCCGGDAVLPWASGSYFCTYLVFRCKKM